MTDGVVRHRPPRVPHRASLPYKRPGLPRRVQLFSPRGAAPPRALAHEQGGNKGVRLHFAASVPRLPVWHESQLRVACWGRRRGESLVLPVGGWTKLTTLESGYWSQCGDEAADVHATLGLDGGV
jgi:hypothetical protein